jgi:hypothetical protein
VRIPLRRGAVYIHRHKFLKVIEEHNANECIDTTAASATFCDDNDKCVKNEFLLLLDPLIKTLTSSKTGLICSCQRIREIIVRLESRKITWVFRARVEDWEKEAIKNSYAVADMRLLKKFKDLVFAVTKENKTFTIPLNNMKWYQSYRMKRIDGGWYIIEMHGDEPVESLMIKDELCMDITDTPQAEGIQIIGEKRGQRKSRL